MSNLCLTYSFNLPFSMKAILLSLSAFFALNAANAQSISQDFEGPLTSFWVGNGTILGPQTFFSPHGGTGMYELQSQEYIYVSLSLSNATKYIRTWVNGTNTNNINIDLENTNSTLVRNIGNFGINNSRTWQYVEYQLGAAYTGSYHIRFKAQGDIYLDDISISTTATPTAITEEIVEMDFKLYPNPTDNSFNLVFRAAIDNLNITITDVAGKTVYTENNNISLAANQTKAIDISNLTAGVYFCKLSNGKNSFVQKIVKN
jgi:hypothetical protein